MQEKIISKTNATRNKLYYVQNFRQEPFRQKLTGGRCYCHEKLHLPSVIIPGFTTENFRNVELYAYARHSNMSLKTRHCIMSL